MKWQSIAIVGLALCVGAQPGASGAPAAQQVTPPAQEPAGALELLFDQGKRLADTFKHEEAIALFDRLIQTLTTGGPDGGIQQPELLVLAYEQRARARFAFGDSPGAERDFAGLLALKPDFKLDATVSPKVMTVLENVRRLTVGQLALQLTPPGEITISGRTYAVADVPLIVDLKSGEHVVSVSRTNFTPFEQTITVNPNELAALTIALERVAATVSVVTATEGVQVWLDGVSKGSTQPGSGAGSAALDIPEVALGDHKLRLVRDCYVDHELTVTVGSEDVRTERIELTRAVATVVIESEDRQARVVVDGEARGPIGSDLTV
jgi:hypothetical protein